MRIHSKSKITTYALRWSAQAVWHWRGPHLLNNVVLALDDGLFGLYGSERTDELFIGTLPPTLSPSLTSLMVSVEAKHHD